MHAVIAMTSTPRRLLRLALRLNATLSTLSALAFILPTRALPALIGLPSSELINLGVGLLVFATVLWGLATRPMERRWVQIAVLFVVMLDVLWVVDVVVQLFTSPAFTVAGRWIFGGLAFLVVALAELQGYALWRVYAQAKPSPATG